MNNLFSRCDQAARFRGFIAQQRPFAGVERVNRTQSSPIRYLRTLEIPIIFIDMLITYRLLSHLAIIMVGRMEWMLDKRRTVEDHSTHSR